MNTIQSIPTQDITFILPIDNTGNRTLVTMSEFKLTRYSVSILWRKEKIDTNGNIIINENLKQSMELLQGNNNIIIDQTDMSEVGVLLSDGRIRTHTDITHSISEDGKPITIDNSTYLSPDENNAYNYPNPLAKMLDFFWYVAYNMPVKVADVIKQFGAAKFGNN